MTNPISHVLVPQQTKLTEDEKQKLLSKYNVTTNGLPKILLSDPGISHLEPKEGDVIKIVRESSTAKRTVFYRGVING